MWRTRQSKRNRMNSLTPIAQGGTEPPVLILFGSAVARPCAATDIFRVGLSLPQNAGVTVPEGSPAIPSAGELTGTMFRVCCKCHVVMGTKPCLPKFHAQVSHGICDKCNDGGKGAA